MKMYKIMYIVSSKFPKSLIFFLAANSFIATFPVILYLGNKKTLIIHLTLHKPLKTS